MDLWMEYEVCWYYVETVRSVGSDGLQSRT